MTKFMYLEQETINSDTGQVISTHEQMIPIKEGPFKIVEITNDGTELQVLFECKEEKISNAASQ